jgi:hypothetical protein
VTIVVRTTVQVGKIVTKLATDAAKGDVAAARELRAYLSEVVVEQDTDLSALDARTLQALKARLLQEIAEAEEHDAFAITTEEVAVEPVDPV